ncbi:serine proteinase stubble isoform X1 [Eurytemora carolleeae]|uniref:serine proteinase stubble isoform X1 n=2 Tax=Eurytemora carolleeae TaxID=1294199 RepID=UPI000C778DB9|nr:serine proteinase stubble isoform X1 [Eurytemora carolleeae]XP_023333490.1 serine proteinase stubble isoform X1 [Eurytemora carolleeae]|eukprot:XP_023333489.1 serine proteinase stubble-like isoform X1 [Eurytemora affinis]
MMLPRLVFLLFILPRYISALFFGRFFSLFGPDPRLQASCTGQCMFDLSCRLKYGQKAGECGGFYQVCCTFDGFGRALGGSNIRQDRQLNLQDFGPVENERGCGRSGVSSRSRRVVGGTEAGFGSFPWIALIRGGNSRCGGALIRPSWVITAGHCVKTAQWPSRYRVYLGEYNLYQNSEPMPRQKFYVSEIVLHPNYQFTPQADRYDVALLKLDRPATLMPHISPICLPDPVELETGERTIVAGWGATQPDQGSRPKVLQAVDVYTLNNTDCESWHLAAGIRVNIYPEMMCAGHQEGGKDACQGDSGGPLMLKDETGKWNLVGVVSAGYSCAKPGQPGIYHRISESSSWVSYVTKNEV